MLNIVLPMAGRGSRFSNAGYLIPKPFIPVNNKPMIQVVVENLVPKGIDSRFIFVCQKSHLKQFNGRELLKSLDPRCEIIELEEITSGQLSSALLAKDLINSSEPLLTANTDQFIEFDFTGFLKESLSSEIDGSILTMPGTDPKWSYIRTDPLTNLVVETAEKKVISSEATVGVYFFKKGSDFCTAAENMIEDKAMVNGEYYICPVYNYLIKKGRRISYSRVNKMHGLGTPEDLLDFLKLDIAKLV